MNLRIEQKLSKRKHKLISNFDYDNLLCKCVSYIKIKFVFFSHGLMLIIFVTFTLRILISGCLW